MVQQLKQRRYLVVLDNFEDALEGGRCRSEELGQLLWAMTDRPHLSQLILTSREMVQDLVDPREPGGLPNPLQVKVERLPGIGTAASVALLKNYGLEDDEADLNWVAWRVGGHVLLLTLLAKLAIGKKGYLRKNPQLVSRKAGPILEEQLGRQSEAAVELLKRMCVPRGAIGAEGLTFLRLYEDGQEVVFAGEEVDRTELLLKQLSDASLVQRRFDEERCEDLYDLHQVIVDFLQAKYAVELPELMRRVYEFYRAGSYIREPKGLEDLKPLLEAQNFAFQLCNYTEAFNLASQLDDWLKPWGHWTLLQRICLPLQEHLKGINYRICVQILGGICRDTGKWDEAEAYFRKSLDDAETNDSDSGRATSLGFIGDIERNRGNWNEAERLYRKCLEVEEELGDRLGMASSWVLLGDIERNRGNWDEAEHLFRKSLELREELGDRSGMASSWGVLGDIECKWGNWEEAERLYRKCLEVEEELGDRSGMASSWGSLGDIERKWGNWEKAERLYRKCLEVREELGERWEMAICWGLLGDIERNRGNWDEAEQLYQQSIELRRELGDRAGIAWITSDRGANELGRGNLELAESLLKESLEQLQQLGMTDAIAATNEPLAKLYRAKGNPDLAQTHYATSHRLFTQLGAAKDLERIEKEWAES